MKCSFLIFSCFIICSIAYGGTSVVVSEGIKHFPPLVLIGLRMFFGNLFCLLVLLIRYLFEENYKEILKAHFTSGYIHILNMIIGGLLNLALPHSILAIAQQWIPSAAVQLAKPLIPAISAILSHYLPINEKFSIEKLLALITAVIGVILSVIPSFISKDQSKPKNMLFYGYLLLLLAVFILGFAAVFFRWKTPDVDITISSVVQTGFSCLFVFGWSIIKDGPANLYNSLIKPNLYGWIWPLLLGILASGVAVHCFMFLVRELGAVGSGFIPFGQIVVGVLLGVLVLGEWSQYTSTGITMQVFGILFLSSAIIIGFYNKKEIEENLPEEVIESSSDELQEI